LCSTGAEGLSSPLRANETRRAKRIVTRYVHGADEALTTLIDAMLEAETVTQAISMYRGGDDA
jgi:hypothetical protein